MALLWLEGFEGYGASIQTQIGAKYPTTQLSNNGVTTGRFGGTAATGGSSGTGSRFVASVPTGSTYFAGCAIKFRDYSIASFGHQFLAMFSGGTRQFALFMHQDDLVAAKNVTQISRAKNVFKLERWYYVEFGVVIGASGSFTVRVDGVEVLNESAVDTGSSVNGFAIEWGRLGSGTRPNIIDDVYCCNDVGSINNTFLGDIRVAGSFPTSDGTVNFTPDTGTDNFDRINEVQEDGDTSYVESSTNGHRDLYNYENVSNFDVIHGIQINTYCKQSGGEDLIIPIDSDTDTAQSVASGYSNRYRLQETDPNTSAKWAQAALNSAQIGVEVSV